MDNEVGPEFKEDIVMLYTDNDENFFKMSLMIPFISIKFLKN